MVIYVEWIGPELGDDEHRYKGVRLQHRFPRDEVRYVEIQGSDTNTYPQQRTVLVMMAPNRNHSFTAHREIALQIYNDLTRHDVDCDVCYTCRGTMDEKVDWVREERRPAACWG